MNRVNAILNHEMFQMYIKKIAIYEKERIFCRHDIEHSLSVARIMYIQSLEKRMDIKKDMIYAAALLHDIGRASAYETGKPHAIEAEIPAKTILKQCGYNAEETEHISSAILNHHHANDEEGFGGLLNYADKISRNCFLCSASNDCNWSEEKRNHGVTV
jgi:uncharacterized domain HDIG